MHERDYAVTPLSHLGPQERRQAKYLEALGLYRELAAQFTETGRANAEELRAAADAVARYEPTPQERMRPIREVSEMTGVSAPTLRRWAAQGQVEAEKRYGKLWYIDPQDVELAVAQEESDE